MTRAKRRRVFQLRVEAWAVPAASAVPVASAVPAVTPPVWEAEARALLLLLVPFRTEMAIGGSDLHCFVFGVLGNFCDHRPAHWILHLVGKILDGVYILMRILTRSGVRLFERVDCSNQSAPW